jgi:hypothetical protein
VRQAAATTILLGLALHVPALAGAQSGVSDGGFRPVGERYHVEVAGSLWNPAPFGQIASDSFDDIGSAIDFTTDLGYEATRLKEFRLVLRPAPRIRLRLQHTPVRYAAETSFTRTITFGGTPFPVSVPIVSDLTWKVWRGGLEYDVFYRPRGFVGVLVEARYTQLDATVATNTPFFSPALEAGVVARAPLPAVGAVGRVYLMPNLALNVEVSGFRVPRIDDEIEARYADWDVHGTLNLNEFVGVQVGWRRMTTYLSTGDDLGDVRFSGIWFGGALRY